MKAKSIVSAALAVIVLSALAVSPALAGPKFKFRLATLTPKGSTWMNTMEAMGAAINEKSGGQIEFKWFPGGAMGDEKDFLKELKKTLPIKDEVYSI